MDKDKKRKVTVYLDPDTWRNLKAYNFHAYQSSYGANSATVNQALDYFIAYSAPVTTGTMFFHSGDGLMSHGPSGLELITEEAENDQEK